MPANALPQAVAKNRMQVNRQPEGECRVLAVADDANA